MRFTVKRILGLLNLPSLIVLYEKREACPRIVEQASLLNCHIRFLMALLILIKVIHFYAPWYLGVLDLCAIRCLA